MQATTKKGSIDRWRKLLDLSNAWFTISATGSKIVIEAPNRCSIEINHNADYHWTIRIPGTAEDGMRFNFNADVVIDQAAELIVINNILAIRYSSVKQK